MAPLPFLDRLSDEDRQALLEIGTVLDVGRGEILLSQHQVPDQVVVVLRGHVKVVASSATRSDVVLAIRGPGSILGEQALVDGAPRGANVVAIVDLEVLVVAGTAFAAFFERRPAVARALLALLSERLRESDRRLVEFAAADTLGRVAARLVELADGYGDIGADGSIQLMLPLTQEELAGWTGSSIEATGKALRTLRELSWITTARRSIVVLDLEALRARAW